MANRGRWGIGRSGFVVCALSGSWLLVAAGACSSADSGGSPSGNGGGSSGRASMTSGSGASGASAASAGGNASASGAASSGAGGVSAAGSSAGAGTSTTGGGGGSSIGGGATSSAGSASAGASSGAGGDAGGAGQDEGGGGTSEASTGNTGGGAPDPALETITVPGSTGMGTSKTSLDAGELFLLRASGTVAFGATTIDAEFGGFGAGSAGSDAVGGVDVGLDFGLKTVRAAVPAVPGRMKWFGDYRDDHVYYVIVNGVGSPLALKLLAPAGGAGSGSIAVSLYRLSPTPQPVGQLIETVMAPLTQTPAKSVAATTTGTVYLLQCDGQGPVGGGGLGDGDADWMDYAADGSGKLDIGDAHTDYGLGVDEPFVGAANTNSPRKRWWGQWRKDHIYYMLFAGTGNPIQFNYYDVGYGDNSATIKLKVGIRALH